MSAAEGARRLAAAQAGGFAELGRLLTWLESEDLHDVLELRALWQPQKAAFRLGITGPPGAGKSTLVGKLIGHLRALNWRVGVLAVDPTSPFSHGAILGDRIRYSEHYLDPGVFIRSLGTRGSLGGLCGAAYLMSRAFDACAFDVLLIETVGVGQTELDILHVADQVCVVLVPESGDSVQAMKAGLMEIADVFVVNKADRPGADGLAREIEAAVHLSGDDASTFTASPVFKCVATSGDGVDALIKWLVETKDAAHPVKNRTQPDRLRQEAKELLRQVWEGDLERLVGKIQNAADLQKIVQSQL